MSHHLRIDCIFCTQFYEKNDQLLPGKKGISLTLEQYQALRDLILDGAIDKEIEELEKKL